MEFLQIITGMLLSGTYALSLMVFLVSALLLGAGLALQVRSDAHHLRFLERKPLSWIERAHPHLPSLRVLVTVNLCGLTLLAVGLQTFRGIFPFNDPYQGLNLASLFLLASAIGTLGELRWKGTKAWAFAFILGTSVAFLTLTFLIATPPAPLPERLLLGGCTVVATVLAWGTLGKGTAGRRTMIVAAAVFAFWFLIYTLQ
jgi:hypothetical protein